MYYRVTRWDLMATLPLFVLYLVLARPMMAVFGPEFGEGAMAVVVLAVGQLVNIGTGPVGTLLMMTGYQRVILWANLGQCLLAAGLLLLLTPHIGLLGAAVASCLSTSLFYIGLYLYARRHFPLCIYNYHTARLLISSAILGFLAWGVRDRLEMLGSPLTVLIVAFLGLYLLWGLWVYGTSMDSDDRRFMAEALKGIRLAK